MAVAENGVASGGNHYESTDLDRSNDNHIKNNEKTEKCSLKSQSLPKNDAVVVSEEKEDDYNSNNNNNNNLENNHSGLTNSGSSENSGVTDDDDFDDDHQNIKFDDNNNNDKNENGKDFDEKEEEGFKKEIRDLQEMLSKLNPMAKEFVPPSLVNYVNINNNMFSNNNGNFGYVNNFLIAPLSPVAGNVNGFSGRRRRNGYGNGKRRMNTRTSMAQREDVIRRTLYVSDIDQQVTEEQLAALFINCGPVVDCRICGDPNSVLRFAFVEFMDEEGANAALSLSGTMLGYYPVRVLPSKTAIAPVNPTFLPKSEGEREMCARTVYCTNIDKKVTQSEVKLFFESFCGEVHRLRLLGDYHHSTRIAFVEFAMAESAISALNCSGAVLGSLPIRVSPSKTPVRPRPPRSPLH